MAMRSAQEIIIILFTTCLSTATNIEKNNHEYTDDEYDLFELYHDGGGQAFRLEYEDNLYNIHHDDIPDFEDLAPPMPPSEAGCCSGGAPIEIGVDVIDQKSISKRFIPFSPTWFVMRTFKFVKKVRKFAKKHNITMARIKKWFNRIRTARTQMETWKKAIQDKVDHWLRKWNNTLVPRSRFPRRRSRMLRYVHGKLRRQTVTLLRANETAYEKDFMVIKERDKTAPPVHRFYEFTRVRIICPKINPRFDDVLFFNSVLPMTRSFYIQLSSEKELVLEPAWRWDTGYYTCYVNDTFWAHASLEFIPIDRAIVDGLTNFGLIFLFGFLLVATIVVVRCILWYRYGGGRRKKGEPAQWYTAGGKGRKKKPEPEEPKNPKERAYKLALLGQWTIRPEKKTLMSEQVRELLGTTTKAERRKPEQLGSQAKRQSKSPTASAPKVEAPPIDAKNGSVVVEIHPEPKAPRQRRRSRSPAKAGKAPKMAEK